MSSYNDRIMNDTQREIVSLIRQIGEKEILPKAAEYEERHVYPTEWHQIMLEAGLYGLDVPEELGGMGIDNFTHAIISEELAYFDAGFAMSFLGGSGGVQTILDAGRTDLAQAVAKRVLEEGAMISFCLTEPGSGSDAGNTRTTATKVDGGYVLNGTKCFITNGGISDYFLVVATLDRELAHKGMCMFLVDKEMGVQHGANENKMGLRCSNTAEVVLDNVFVPADRLLGEEGGAFKIIMKNMDVGRPMQMCESVGIAQRALDEAVKYSLERVTFGKPIIEHQGLAFLLADMQAKVHASRIILQQALKLADEGKLDTNLASCSKFFSSEQLMQVTIDAVQVLGGYGYSREYPVEKLMRDIKVFSIFDGTNQIQRDIVGKQLKREYRKR